MTALLIPLLLFCAGILALSRNADPFQAMGKGAAAGFQILLGIAPSLIVLLSGVAMLRASGALDALAALLSPALETVGLPAEVLPLMLLRPFSGSGALALGADIIRTCGPDSRIGRAASIMLGSTETTFYVLAVYFGANRGKWSRRAIPAALAADLTGFFLAAWTADLLR